MEFTCFSECLRGSCLRCSFARTNFKWNRSRGNARPVRTQVVTVPNRAISSDRKNIFKDSRSDLGLCQGYTTRCLYGSNVHTKLMPGHTLAAFSNFKSAQPLFPKQCLLLLIKKVQDEAQRRNSIPWAT